MTRATHLSHGVEITEYEAKYDDAAKRLVADKQVLARIAKGTVKEFKNCSIEEIMEAIEGEPEIATHKVHPGKPSRRKEPDGIHGMNTESTIPGEGNISYDIYFYILTQDKERIKVIINIELQNDYYPGYHFGSRGVYYCSRMISEQKDTEFSGDDYDKIKKVYSIWICMKSPEKYANTITECSMHQREVYGNYDEEENCDLISVIIIRLSTKENSDSRNELIDMLTTLFSEKKDAETKKKELATKFGMVMTETVEGGLRSMCNLGAGMAERAIQRGLKEGREQGLQQGLEQGLEQGLQQGLQQRLIDNVKSLQNNLNLTLEEALKALDVTMKEYETAKVNVGN